MPASAVHGCSSICVQQFVSIVVCLIWALSLALWHAAVRAELVLRDQCPAVCGSLRRVFCREMLSACMFTRVLWSRYAVLCMDVQQLCFIYTSVELSELGR